MLDKYLSKWSYAYLRNLPPLVHEFEARGHIIVKCSLVIIWEDNMPRLQWPLGVVDGVVRSVSLHTAKRVEVRAIQSVHDLEIADSTNSKDINDTRISISSLNDCGDDKDSLPLPLEQMNV